MMSRWSCCVNMYMRQAFVDISNPMLSTNFELAIPGHWVAHTFMMLLVQASAAQRLAQLQLPPGRDL